MYREGTLTFQHCLSLQLFLCSVLLPQYFSKHCISIQGIKDTVSINTLTIFVDVVSGKMLGYPINNLLWKMPCNVLILFTFLFFSECLYIHNTLRGCVLRPENGARATSDNCLRKTYFLSFGASTIVILYPCPFSALYHQTRTRRPKFSDMDTPVKASRIKTKQRPHEWRTPKVTEDYYMSHPFWITSTTVNRFEIFLLKLSSLKRLYEKPYVKDILRWVKPYSLNHLNVNLTSADAVYLQQQKKIIRQFILMRHVWKLLRK